jgi:outer membrane protein, heavy metal efflux system
MKRPARRGATAALVGLILATAAASAVLGTQAASAEGQRPSPPPLGLAPLPLLLAPRAAPLELEEAERRLLERNLAVVAAKRGVDAARAQILVAGSLPPPQVTVGGAFAQASEPVRGRGARLYSPYSNTLVGLAVLVERGGKRALRSRLADQQVGVAEAQVLDALRLQIFQLRQAFLGALLARANLEVAFANRQSLDRTEALLRRQWREGAVPEGDLLRFQASRLPFEADVTSGAQAYASGVAAVAALLGEDAALVQPGAGQSGALGLPIMDAAPPSRPGPSSAPTTVRTVLSPVPFDLRGRFAVTPELGIGRDELAQAVASRADVVAAQRQVTAAAANTRLAEAQRRRDVTLNGTWLRSRLPQDLPDVADRLDAINQFSLTLSIPIFTARIVEGNVGTAQAQQGQAEALARAALLGARAEFAAAWATYEQARSLLELYASGATNRAEEAYRSTEQAYLAGGRSLVDVLDALRVLNATRLQANQARHAYLLALAALEQVSGVSGIAPRL